MISKRTLKLELRDLILLGVVIAIKIILHRFSIGTAVVHVSLDFIGSVMLGFIFGPVWGSVGGAIGDLVSSAIFGNQGGYFIGFTLSAMVGPLIYGLFFYHRPVKIWRIILSTLLVTVIVNVGLNTLWVHVLYGLNFNAALVQRLPKELIVPWVQMFVIYFVLQALSRVKMKR
ncbi:folate family ECF transporter S component [Lactobacillus sp. ESL0701]|uniref:folate family ECF transporter S component n=1 Tax=Lactobacillus sp. ESL0701 TaxID=2983217 RepID=UPI0023F949F0|nr:folate family ECF transporter S component [Lactobacillus sp. ESL0701]MDF7673131.1 folate family ECF transporter S component [Lactobacillus sp. ESL0701]